MKTSLFTIIAIGLQLCCRCVAQVSTNAPRNWETSSIINFGFGLSTLKLAHNRPEIIRQEILDPDTVLLIARTCGLSAKDLATVQIVQNAKYDWVEIYQLGKAKKPFEVLSEQLRNYVRAREEGHTRTFFLASLTNQPAPAAIPDPDVRAIATQRKLPISWLQKTGSGTTTNKAGEVASRTTTTTIVNGKSTTKETTHIPRKDEVCRWVSFSLVDGEVAWRYVVKFKADGSVDYVNDSKCDAKEFDPKYQQTIKAVETDVENEMKKNGSYRQFGSVHEYWQLKKEKLKAKGIEWRSPSELNPNTSYD